MYYTLCHDSYARNDCVAEWVNCALHRLPQNVAISRRGRVRSQDNALFKMIWNEMNLYEWAGKELFVSLKLEYQSGVQTRDLRLSKQAALTMLYSISYGFILCTMHSTLDSTAHSRPLNSLKHCICTTRMKNIRPRRNLNPLPLLSQQPRRISHHGRRHMSFPWVQWPIPQINLKLGLS